MATSVKNEIPELDSDELVDLIVGLYLTNKQPVMIWGPPGAGKTAMVYKAADEIGGEVVDFRLVTTEPTDLRGYPFMYESEAGKKQMAWAPAGLLPEDPDWKGFIFLDEIPQAPTMNMNAAAELVYDRRLGNDYKLPEGAMVVAAGNRRSDRAGTIEMPTHLKNRFVHAEMKTMVERWVTWAHGAKVHSGLISFLESNPRLLHDCRPDATAFPSPRTWEFVSDILNSPYLNNTIKWSAVAGAVGNAAAAELKAWISRNKNMPTYEDIVADPHNAYIGTNENEAYVLSDMVAKKAQEEHIDQVLAYLSRFRRDKVKAVLIKMKARNASFMNSPAFRDALSRIGDEK